MGLNQQRHTQGTLGATLGKPRIPRGGLPAIGLEEVIRIEQQQVMLGHRLTKPWP